MADVTSHGLTVLVALALASGLVFDPAVAAAQDRGYAPVPVDDDPPPNAGGDAAPREEDRGYAAVEDAGTGEVTASRQGGESSGGTGNNPDILRPSTRPMWAIAAFGPDLYDLNVGGTGAPGARRQNFTTRMNLAVDFGYHFDGNGEGPAIGGTIEQTFGSGLYTFNPAGKFWWDIEIADMAIYVAPFGKVGYVLGSTGGGGGGGVFVHGLNLGLGAEGRVVLDDRWMLIARPAAIDMVIGDFGGDNFLLAASFLIGGGATF